MQTIRRYPQRTNICIIDVWTEIARQYREKTGRQVNITELNADMNAFTLRSYVTSNALFLNEPAPFRENPLRDGIAQTVGHFLAASP